MSGACQFKLIVLIFATIVANGTTRGRGKQINKSDQPYQVSLQVCGKSSDKTSFQRNSIMERCSPPKGQHLCSGFILNERAIVTVGLCVIIRERFPTHDLYVVAGITELYVDQGNYHKVVEIKRNPKDTIEFTEQGVALVFVNPHFEWSELIKPINHMNMNAFSKRDCSVSGFVCKNETGCTDSGIELEAIKIDLTTHVSCEAVIRVRGFVSKAGNFLCFRMQAICEDDLGNLLTCNGAVVALATNLYTDCEKHYVDIYIKLMEHNRFLKLLGTSSSNSVLLSTVIICMAFIVILRQ